MNNSVVDVLVYLGLQSLFLSFLYYRFSFSERTLFGGRLQFLQFLWSIVLPPLLLMSVFQLYRMIERNPAVLVLPWGDDLFLYVTFMLVTWASVGNGMHAAGVSIDYRTKDLNGLSETERAVIRVVAFFHHGFSHLLIQLPVVLITFVFVLFEFNHPSPNVLTGGQLSLVLFFGLVFGVVLGLGAIDGSVPKSFLPIATFLSAAIWFLWFRLGQSIFLLPTTLYFGTANTTSALFLIFWGLYHRGFPEIIGELKIKEGHPLSPRLSRLNSHEASETAA